MVRPIQSAGGVAGSRRRVAGGAISCTAAQLHSAQCTAADSCGQLRTPAAHRQSLLVPARPHSGCNPPRTHLPVRPALVFEKLSFFLSCFLCPKIQRSMDPWIHKPTNPRVHGPCLRIVAMPVLACSSDTNDPSSLPADVLSALRSARLYPPMLRPSCNRAKKSVGMHIVKMHGVIIHTHIHIRTYTRVCMCVYNYMHAHNAHLRTCCLK